MVAKANSIIDRATVYSPGVPKKAEKLRTASDAPFWTGKPFLAAAQRMTRAVTVQTKIVSKNTSNMAHIPCSSGVVSSAAP